MCMLLSSIFFILSVFFFRFSHKKATMLAAALIYDEV